MAGRTRGVGAHTDFGALTLLLQDEGKQAFFHQEIHTEITQPPVGGLEVLHRGTSTWHAVVPIKGAYVVNIGDLMRKSIYQPLL